MTLRRRRASVAARRGRAGTRMPIDLAHLSDEALVALCARSDEVALAELYDRYGRVAYGLALRILRDEALAEDAVQEAFLTVWRSAGRFVPERAKASTWILTLVHRRAVDLVRRERAPARRAARDRAGGDRASRPRTSAWLRLQRERVQEALKQLPDPAARGARARLLRRLHAVRARREARAAARYDQEQDVRRPGQAPGAAGRARRRSTDGTRPSRRADGRATPSTRSMPRRTSASTRITCATARGCREELASLQEAAAALAYAVDAPAAAAAAPRADPRRGPRRAQSNVVPLRRRWVVPGARRRRRGRPPVSRSGSGSGAPASRATSTDERARARRRARSRRSSQTPDPGNYRCHGANGHARRRDGRQRRTRPLGARQRAAPGKTYEAWVIEDGSPLAAGVFAGGGHSVVPLDRAVPAEPPSRSRSSRPAASRRRPGQPIAIAPTA